MEDSITTVLAAILYLVPSIIAVVRGHRNALAITAFNLILVLLPFAYIFWVIALIWSLTSNTRRS